MINVLVAPQEIEDIIASLHRDGKIYATAVRVSSDHVVHVFLDGDDGVTIGDCAAVSRQIREALGERADDYSLEVSSHGATSPLVMPRQYRRHVGRTFELKLADGEKLEAELAEYGDDALLFRYQTREPKPLGKGKATVVNERLIPFNQIREARIKLKF